jgi:acetyl esterase/lipase
MDEKAFIDPSFHAFYDALPTVRLSNAEQLAAAQKGASVSAALLAKRPPLDERIQVEQVEIAGRAAFFYTLKANAGRKGPALLFLHGGGYVLGHPQLHESLYVAIMLALPVSILAPQYRRATEAPYPAGADAMASFAPT